VLSGVISFFAHNPLLLLFAVVALGYPISKIRIAGASLGIASILFAGIGLGAVVVAPDLDPALKKDISKEMKLVYELGLAVFVYAMGLAISHSFWSAFSKEGIKKNAVVAAVMLLSTGLIVVVARALHFDSRYAAGLLTGSFTNMPALAGVIELVKAIPGVDAVEIAKPTVASAIAYPVGVLVPMLAILLSRRFFRVDLQEEAKGLHHYNSGLGRLSARTVRVSRPEAEGLTHVDLRDRANCKVVFGRLRRGEEYRVAPLDVKLRQGDLLVLVGAEEDLDRATRILGEVSEIGRASCRERVS
jgi:putative transport protein